MVSKSSPLISICSETLSILKTLNAPNIKKQIPPAQAMMVIIPAAFQASTLNPIDPPYMMPSSMKRLVAVRPHMPPPMCTATASSGSSTVTVILKKNEL